MAKRTAGRELNHDNWDEEDNNEEPGLFPRVAESELKNRVIRKAKRNLNNSSGTSQGSSPFAAFSGFSTTGSSAFGSLNSGIGGSGKSFFAMNTFGALKKPDNESSGRSPLHSDDKNATKLENGKSANTLENIKTTDNLENTKPTENLENTKPTDNLENTKPTDNLENTKPTDNLENTKPTDNSETSAKPVASNSTTKCTRHFLYYQQLQNLNQSVIEWMDKHYARNPCSDFTPVFNDYKKHLHALGVTYPILDTDAEKKEDNLSKCSAIPDSLPAENNSNNLDVNTSYKLETVKKDETDYGANFSANTTNTSTFSFGMKSTPSAMSSISPQGPASSSKEEENKPFQFSLSAKSDTQDSAPASGFNFASAIAAKIAEPSQPSEDNYVPPKNDFVAVSEEDALYSKKCKLFFKKGDAFVDKGVGMLYVKSLEGKTQLLIRADTNLGNILLNIMLSASLPMSRTGKNNVLLVTVPNPPMDPKNPDCKEAIPMLMRVKTSEDADELLEILNKYKS